MTSTTNPPLSRRAESLFRMEAAAQDPGSIGASSQPPVGSQSTPSLTRAASGTGSRSRGFRFGSHFAVGSRKKGAETPGKGEGIGGVGGKYGPIMEVKKDMLVLQRQNDALLLRITEAEAQSAQYLSRLQSVEAALSDLILSLRLDQPQGLSELMTMHAEAAQAKAKARRLSQVVQPPAIVVIEPTEDDLTNLSSLTDGESDSDMSELFGESDDDEDDDGEEDADEDELVQEDLDD